MGRYDSRLRTRGTFKLIGREHRGARAGNERLTCHVAGQAGFLVLWGTASGNMDHINAVEAAGFPLAIECDWIDPDPYEAQHFHHTHWLMESDHFKIIG